MENSFNIIEDENINEEYSSFCSSCNSLFQSIRSIGIPSFHELNDENNIISQIEKDENIIEHIDTITEETGNVNEYTSNIKEKTFVKNNNNPTKNSVIPMEFHTYRKQETNNNNDNKTDYSVTKKIKYIELLYKDLQKRENYVTLPDDKNKPFILMKNNLDDIFNYEMPKTKILKLTRKNSSIKYVSSSNDYIVEDILSHRKKILKVMKSILYLW
ncbi:protein PFF0380w-like [Bombus affinis]|uniref:protein PFF0380w-like n=1 Tax=Bombus affinis TaxID=309941 RepID=UPI0021B7E026|nr:protein PFF0380w-like [Bombus affinis]